MRAAAWTACNQQGAVNRIGDITLPWRTLRVQYNNKNPPVSINMAEIAMKDIERTAEPAPVNPFKDPGGKLSKIHAYCNEPDDRGSSCAWFCRRYGRNLGNVLARDI